MYGGGSRGHTPPGRSTPRLVRPWLSPVILGVGIFIVYLSTLAPGLTWANDGADGGDLITAAAVGGVPHPTGYPAYLLLARVFQLLPLGSLAYRTNLMSAAASALAAALLCDFSRRLSTAMGIQSRFAGWIAGLAYGLAPLIWSQSVITEVYALQGFLIAVILWRLASPRHRKHTGLLSGLLIGLLLGVHLTALLILPALLLTAVLPTREGAARSARDVLGGLGIGSLVYLILPLRAAHHPPVNWGDVEAPERFWWLVSGQLYHAYLTPWSNLDLWLRLRSTAALLLHQAGFWGLILAAVGLAWSQRSRWLALTLWMFLANVTFALFYHTEDAYVYLIPAILSFSIWIEWGSTCLIASLPRRWAAAGWTLRAVTIAYLIGLAFWRWGEVDASRDTRAEQFAQYAITTLPRNAIVLASGDGVIFALWYEVFALHRRTDLVVLAEELLPFDWYRQSLRVTYPGVIIPEPTDDVWAAALPEENDGRPFCYVRSENAMEISCR